MSEKYTGLLADIQNIAGDDVALKIAIAVGGTRVGIPPRARGGHWLADLLGFETADQVCQALSYVDNEGRLRGVVQEMIPLGEGSLMKRARALAIKLLDEGQSVSQVARAVGLHSRTVWRIKQRRSQPIDETQERVEAMLLGGLSDTSIQNLTQLPKCEISALRRKLSNEGIL